MYFVQETPDLISLASQLADGDLGAEAGSAAAALLSSVAHSGFQLVVTAPTPHPLKDQVCLYAPYLAKTAQYTSPMSFIKL